VRTGFEILKNKHATLTAQVASLRGGYECAFFAYPLAMRLAGRERSAVNARLFTPSAADIQDTFLATPRNVDNASPHLQQGMLSAMIPRVEITVQGKFANWGAWTRRG
jgi:hypothetical protein